MNVVPVMTETFLRLRRDRIFIPAIFAGAATLITAGLTSYWGVEEFFKILYDLGTTGFHLIGAVVAIFWGVKLISDTAQEGSLEVQLASPVGRTEWLVGKFLGLASALVVLAGIFILGWQVVYSSYGIGFIGWNNILIFSILTLSWLSMGSLAIFLASLSSYAVALFSAMWMFCAGLLAQPIAQSISPDTPDSVKGLIQTFAGLWNLQYFNLYEFGSKNTDIPFQMVYERLGYSAALITFFLCLAAIFFSRKDLAG